MILLPLISVPLPLGTYITPLTMGEANVVLGSGPTPFGKEMKKHFSFAPGYHNLNHGTSPLLAVGFFVPY